LTVLLEGIAFEQFTLQFNGKYPENFKKLLINEIHKYHSTGLKAIKILKLNAYTYNSLVIELICCVNPKYNQEIQTAARRALVSINVSFFFLSKFSSLINLFLV
jgi:hypothetical protein